MTKTVALTAALLLCSACGKQQMNFASTTESQQVASINWDEMASTHTSISPAKNSFLIMMR